MLDMASLQYITEIKEVIYPVVDITAYLVMTDGGCIFQPMLLCICLYKPSKIVVNFCL